MALCAASTATAARRADTNAPADRIELTVLQWNVENLFDFEDDPANEGDDPFTPGGWQYWSEKRYRLKVAHLAEAIAASGADLVCLEEVENRRVLDDLCAALRQRRKDAFPSVAHREGTDHRGIDVAILSRIPPAATRWITPVPEQRDVLIATFEHGGRPFTVFVSHWKSRWGPEEESTRMRLAQARAVRGEVDRLLKADPGAAILVVGDFNDDFGGPAVTQALRSIPDLARVTGDPAGGWLYNLHAQLAEADRGTFYYRLGKSWNAFDTISASRAMLAEGGGGWEVRRDTYGVFHTPAMLDANGRPRPFRRQTNEATRRREYCYGYSDHFPVRVTISLAAGAPDDGAGAGDSVRRQEAGSEARTNAPVSGGR